MKVSVASNGNLIIEFRNGTRLESPILTASDRATTYGVIGSVQQTTTLFKKVRKEFAAFAKVPARKITGITVLGDVLTIHH